MRSRPDQSAVRALNARRFLAQRMAIEVHIRRICATVGLAVFLAASLGYPAGFAAEPKRVMLLYSFGRDFKPWSDMPKPSARNWIGNRHGRWT